MNLTKEDFEALVPYEHILYTSVYCNFLRISKREDSVELDRLYKKIFHTEKGILGGCHHCVYEATKKLGKLYFEDKKEYEAKEAKNKQNENKTPKETVSAKTQTNHQKTAKKASKPIKKGKKGL